MNETTDTGIHWGFWVISVVALLWNLMGTANFFAQMNADFVATYPDTHRAIIDGRPAWATGAFATAVFGGALGCILLLLWRPAALYLFVASLLGVIATMVHTLAVARSAIEFSLFEIVMMMLMPLVVAAFLVWYSKRAENQGWLR